MKLHQTMTSNQQSLLTAGGSCRKLRRLVQGNYPAWFALLPMVVLLALPMVASAQTTRPDRRMRGEEMKPMEPATPAGGPVVIGTSGQTVQIPGELNVGNGRLQVVGSAAGGGVVASNLYIRQLNQSPAVPHVCWRPAADGVQALLITTCTTSQSSLRYKTDLRPYLGGLNVVGRLKPYDFTWKKGGMHDIGLVAEDVAQVEPLLTFNNEQGDIEGVKYENLNVVLINAIKEQQAQIEELRKQAKAQQDQLKQQAQQIETLKKLVAP